MDENSPIVGRFGERNRPIDRTRQPTTFLDMERNQGLHTVQTETTCGDRWWLKESSSGNIYARTSSQVVSLRRHEGANM